MRGLNNTETIVAISTAPGEGAIGVIRLSGERALQIADSVFQAKSAVDPSRQKSFTVQYGYMVDRTGGTLIRVDEALSLVMRGPKSYTREDMVEFSCHGGRVLLQKVLDLCVRGGARLAEPGEFTKRAFLNGRLDLAQAEAVSDLIRAQADLSCQAARMQLEGTLSRFVKEARDNLSDVLSHVEASIDFPDESIESMADPEVILKLRQIQEKVGNLLRRSRSGILLKDGLRAVLVGKPNVGKSSLMNVLTGTNRVLVSDEPGTTRDFVEEQIQVSGLPVRLVDTAGLSDIRRPMEKESVRLAESAINASDLVLFVVDGSVPVSAEDQRVRERISEKPFFLIINKSDLLADGYIPGYSLLSPHEAMTRTSCLTGAGIEELETRLASFVLRDAPQVSEETWVISVRHASLFRKAASHLGEALTSYENGLSSEFAASDIRRAMDALGEIVGEIVTEDILDKIFSQFCIGK